MKKQHGSTRFSKRFRRGVAILAASVVVIVVLVLAFMIPPGAATIPLNVSYAVGEKMVYSITENITNVGEPSTAVYNPTFNLTQTQTVIGYDGQAYSINTTENLGAFSFSYIEVVNQTGYTEDIYSQSSTTEGTAINNANPTLVFLSSPQVKVGDTEVVSLDSNSSDSSSTGNITLTFVDIQIIMVASGTYKVFRVDSTSENMFTTVTPPTSLPENFKPITISVSVNETQYVGFDTGHLISADASFSSTIGGSNITSNAVGHIELMQDTMPQTGAQMQTPSSNSTAAIFILPTRRLNMGF